MVINKYSDVPLYAQLKNILIEKIHSGEYAENSQIPSEQELCDMFNISRPTVRQAISDLTNSGYLQKEKGKGTFVRMSKPTIDLKNYSGFYDSIIDSESYGNKEIISISVVDSSQVDEKILEAFDSKTNNYNDFAEVKYIATEKNEVIAYNTSYIPVSLFPGIADDIAARKPGHEILKGRYPLVPAKAKTSMEIVFSDANDAANMKIQSGQPILKINSQVISKGSLTVEYIISKYRGDRCRFLFENVK